ncbi:MAG: PAS domain S-box protein [Spongiibacteraceae bacterium]
MKVSAKPPAPLIARGPLFVAAAYGVLGLLWITTSDLALDALVDDPRWSTYIAIGKGYAFIGITAVLLFFAINHLQHRVAQVEKNSSAELAASERAYRELFENNPNPMWIIEQQTQRFLSVNLMAERNYGYDRGEFATLTLGDLVDADAIADMPRLLHRDTGGARVRRGISRHRTRDGRLLHVEVASYQTNFDGRPACMLIAHDISRRIEMENDLRASKNLLRFAQQLAGIGTLVINLDNGDISWSEQALALFGLDPGRPGLDMRELLDLVHPDDRELAQQRIALHHGGAVEASTTEIRACLPGGLRHFTVRTRRRYWQTDEQTRVVVAFLDNTERKLIEQRLARSEQHYRQLVDLLPDALFVMAADRSIQFANPAAARVFGAAAPELLLGRDIFELIVDPGADEQLQRAAQAQPGVQMACRWRSFRRLDGATFAGAATATARIEFSDGGRTLQLVIRDLTDLRRVEAQLAHANGRLQRVSSQLIKTDEAVRRRLASELHDDVGQLLTFVTMTSAALRKQLDGTEAENRTVALHAAAREALAKVRDLTLMLRPAQLDAAGLEVALRSHLERFLDGSGLGFQLHCDALTPRPDPETEIALFRIAQEAVTNVLRHAGATHIDIRLRCIPEHIELHLVDDGAGFDVERRLAEALTAGVFGMHERAQLLGGRFQIRSTPGVGTELWARLPLRSQALTMEAEG